MMSLKQLKQLSFQRHIVINIVLRLILIIYGEIQDNLSEVQYTDVDYRVVTDGARYLLSGASPYRRRTYRYTPLLAYLLIPNILIHKMVGKLIFSFFDILVGILIQKILLNEFFAKPFTENKNFPIPKKYQEIAINSALCWLYNPLTMVIATRGNGDSITSFLVLASIYFLLKPTRNLMQFFVCGFIHGLAIHFRIYPIIFSLSYFVYAGSIGNKTKKYLFLKQLILPTKHQLCLIFGTLTSLICLTVHFFRLFGLKFISESYLYHFTRQDIRHNFSLYFYMQYLNLNTLHQTFFDKILHILPQLIILFVVSLRFSFNRKSLPFAVFLQAFTMVTFNSVVTSQYFIWFLSILPLCLSKLNNNNISIRTIGSYLFLWISTQSLWLFSAYLLEFKGWNTFHWIWLSGILFFISNIFLMQRMIKHFKY